MVLRGLKNIAGFHPTRASGFASILEAVSTLSGLNTPSRLQNCRDTLYWTELWGETAKPKLEILQNKFMRWILGLPPGTPSAHFRAELGLPSIAARIDLAYLRYWHRLNNLEDSSLTVLLARTTKVWWMGTTMSPKIKGP